MARVTIGATGKVPIQQKVAFVVELDDGECAQFAADFGDYLKRIEQAQRYVAYVFSPGFRDDVTLARNGMGKPRGRSRARARAAPGTVPGISLRGRDSRQASVRKKPGPGRSSRSSSRPGPGKGRRVAVRNFVQKVRTRARLPPSKS